MALSVDAPFRNYKTTEVESYGNGLKTGFEWQSNYRPGGPWVCSPDHCSDPDWVEYCARTAQNNKRWLEGFDDGIICQIIFTLWGFR